MSRSRRAGIYLVIIAAAVLPVYFLDYLPHQRGLREAGILGEALEARLAADPRFRDATVRVSTIPNVLIHGTVSDPAALEALRFMIPQPTSATFKVRFNVRVAEDVTTLPATGPTR